MRFAYLFNTALRAISLSNKERILYSFNFHYFTLKHYSKEIMNVISPNILVYTGSNSLIEYNRVESSLVKCLGSNDYIVYHLLPSEINEHLWMTNALLLVVVADNIDGVAKAFETYFREHGNILIVSSKFTLPFLDNKCDKILNEECLVQTTYLNIGEAVLPRGKYSYCSNGLVLCWDSNNKPLIWKIKDNKHTLILSEIYLMKELDPLHCSSMFNEDKCLLILKHILKEECGLEVKNGNESVSKLSPGYFFNRMGIEMVQSMNSLNFDNISREKSIFSHCEFKYENELIKLPIYIIDDSCSYNFDRNLYFANLHTDIYGHSVVYFPTITTTMEAAKQLSGHEGIVIIADCQLSGRGRGSNKWISPVGCAMFTLNFTVSISSPLGKRLPLLQHMAALAVIHGIKKKNAYKALDLKIKWPNDIYNDKIKLGGLIVTSELQKDSATINIGWGINVNNTKPTLCINDVIDNYNSLNSCSLPHLSREEIIAFTVSQMEYFVKDFMTFGSEKFFENYYTHWMHGNQRVTLTNSNMQGTVIGLDEFGFLKVKSDDDKILVFQPDGNRFDIMKNLIQSN